MRLPQGICLAVLLLGNLTAATLLPLAEPRLWQRAEWRIDGAPATANNFDPDLRRRK